MELATADKPFMDILAIEPDEAVIPLFSAAVERMRPGTDLGFATDIDAAATTVTQCRRRGAAAPALVVLGPQAPRVSGAELNALRKVLGSGIPVLALAASAEEADHARSIGVDEVFQYELSWDALCREIGLMLTHWFRKR